MGRKAFLEDLEAASAPGKFSNILDVKRGEDDGAISFRVPSDLSSPVRASAIVTDVSDYPSSHEYYIFSESEEIPTTMAAVFEKVPRSVSALKISDMLNRLSEALERAAFPNDGDMEIDSDYQGSEDEDEEEVEGLDFGDHNEDYWDEEPSSNTTFTGPRMSTSKFAPASATFQGRDALLSRIRHDLRKAKEAGLKVGVLGEPLYGGFVCVSCRVVKLGLSEEAMKAWGLRRYHYLVLLIQYPSGYKTLEQISESSRVDMRVALCRRYKPTLDEAYAAFSQLTKEKLNPSNATIAVRSASETSSNLEGLFIGRPLNDLLNSRLGSIIKFRLSCGFGWSAAELFYDDTIGMAMGNHDPANPRYAIEDKFSHVALPKMVTEDHIMKEPLTNSMSFPLVAMQFVFRHFVRCTEFCLICHCKVDSKFEALKPYVCSKPLCLYQYMSLGFGPRIEWEILTQPYTVDLLVSFCYTSAVSNKLKSFPVGLGLQVPSKQPQTIKAKFNRHDMELLFPDRYSANPLKKGDWIVLNHGASAEFVVHARVTEILYWPKVSLGPPVPIPRRGTNTDTRYTYPYSSGQAQLQETSPTPAPTPPPPSENEAFISIYDQNFDELSDVEKNHAIITLLDTLPDVSSMRAFLQSRAHGHDPSLMTWRDRISKPALDILRWIIASNRSCIIQVDQMAEPAQLDPASNSPPTMSVQGTKENPINLEDTAIKEFANEERVFGMTGWLQFRFAQGAPDKEQRFVDSVRDAKTRLQLEHPTIFAWHGSPLYNWHSIVREGLHFNETAHGRAFGDGVYMSNNFLTSHGYSGMNYSYRGSGQSGTWPQSVLKIGSALSLNEVVNAPGEFVSRSPHYVVSQIDWIQTRYLFIKAESDVGHNLLNSPPSQTFPQDPKAPVTGCDNKVIQIPLTAVSKSRRPVQSHYPERKGSKKAKIFKQTDQQEFEQVEDDAASIATDTEDLIILFSDTETRAPSTRAGNQKVKEKIKEKGKNKALPDLPKTDFVPDKLDYSTFPILKPPSNASIQATKTLQRLLKSTLITQNSTPLHELGWYINPSATENMYQWIVELHSFEPSLPLAKDLKTAGLKSVVLEVRFTANYPISPPFVRVIRPRFLPFASGGGGHVTAGGAICMELLTNSGWSPVSSIESVLLQVKIAMSSLEPRPARLENTSKAAAKGGMGDYGTWEAVDAYKRACAMHGWEVPKDFDDFARMDTGAGAQGRY
ncbi:MAG: hypothetical protein Q9160_004093 [Pyrenula sp. 1 TL-2023]